MYTKLTSSVGILTCVEMHIIKNTTNYMQIFKSFETWYSVTFPISSGILCKVYCCSYFSNHHVPVMSFIFPSGCSKYARALHNMNGFLFSFL